MVIRVEALKLFIGKRFKVPFLELLVVMIRTLPEVP